jgi:hypothetical protein
MNLLPQSLGKLADIADRNSTRPGLHGIQLRTAADGTFTAAATDGHVGLIVTGPRSDDAGYPVSAVLAAEPNGELSALIPAEIWKREFAAAVKLTKKAKPALRALAVSIGKTLTTLAAVDDHGASTYAQPINIDARFPSLSDVIPASSKARAAVRLDPWQLAALLEIVGHVTDAGTPGNNPGIVLGIHDLNRITVQTNGDAGGLRPAGILMGIEDAKLAKRKKPADAPADAELDATRAELDAAGATVRKERNQLETDVTTLRAALDAARHGNAGAEAGVRAAKDRAAALEAELVRLRATDHAGQRRQLETEIDRLRAERDEHAENLKKARAGPAVGRTESTNAAINRLARRAEDAEADLDEARTESAHHADTIVALKIGRDALRAELDTTAPPRRPLPPSWTHGWAPKRPPRRPPRIVRWNAHRRRWTTSPN